MNSYITKILSFVRGEKGSAKVTDVEVEKGGGDVRTAQHFSAPGDDSFPCDDDYVLIASVPRSGAQAANGYLDPNTTPKAQKGDKRIYGRDSAGSEVNQVWLKNDGSLLISNDNVAITIAAAGSVRGENAAGSFEMGAGGIFTVNDVVTIDTSGNIVTPGTITAGGVVTAPTVAAATSLTVAGKEMSGHTHSQGNDSRGDSQVNTNAPV